MVDAALQNSLHMRRREAGLNQRQVAEILGSTSEDQVSRYERSEALPPLAIALGFEALFRIPVSQLFWGARDAAQARVSDSLKSLAELCQEKSGRGPDAARIAHFLEWLKARELENR